MKSPLRVIRIEAYDLAQQDAVKRILDSEGIEYDVGHGAGVEVFFVNAKDADTFRQWQRAVAAVLVC